MKAVAVALLVLGLIIIFLPKTSKIEPQFERTEIQLKVHFYDSKKELHKAISQYTEVQKGHQGISVFSPGDNLCDVHVMRPDRVDDSNTLTLGHEVLHCVHGLYH